MTGVASTLGPSAYWYLARGTGAVSLLLLTATVVLGVLGTLRYSARLWPRFAIDALHRDISLLVIALIVVHVVTSVLDGFAPISLTDGIIPFATPYRSLWMGLGALSFDLLIALVVTSLVRRRLGYKSWRAIHWLAYVSWPIAVLHGLGTGSDVKSWWLLALTIACVAAVVVAVLVRVARSDPLYAGLRGPATALAVVVPIGIAVFTLAGPLQPGWARRAGTPAKLLAHTPAATRPVSSTGPASLNHPFTATLDGTVTQTAASGGAIVEISGRVSGGVRGLLRVRMGGAPLSGGGLSLTGSQVDLTAAGMPSPLQGRIVSLQGQQFLARLADGAGSVVNLQADLNIDESSGSVTGTLTGSPAR
jgi:methionine sulfoxide reductase heme-binding subunit